MKNIPEKIYLQIGCGFEDIDDFKKLPPLGWSEIRISPSDLMYSRSDRSQFIYLVLGIENGIIYGCFKKEKSAERYVGNNPRFEVKKVRVE